MRRLPSALLLAALAPGTTAFAPTAPAPTAPQPASTAAAAANASENVVCVRFREWTVPVVGDTEPDYERFCLKAPDVNPDMLPVPEGSS